MDEILDFNSEKKLIEASNGIRFFNLIIDYVFFVILVVILIIIFQFDENNDSIINLLAIIGYVLYTSVFEIAFNKTPAKFITKTHVVTDTGEKPTPLNIIGRNLCRIIPFDALSFLFGSSGWHDKFSGTKVIKD